MHKTGIQALLTGASVLDTRAHHHDKEYSPASLQCVSTHKLWKLMARETEFHTECGIGSVFYTG